MRFAELRPQLAGSLFPSQNPRIESVTAVPKVPRMNMSRRRSHNDSLTDTGDVDIFDEFEDNVLDDGELMAASTNPACFRSVRPAVLNIPLVDDIEFSHVDSYENAAPNFQSQSAARSKKLALPNASDIYDLYQEEDLEHPRQLENGKWTCNHRCKNKQTHVLAICKQDSY